MANLGNPLTTHRTAAVAAPLPLIRPALLLALLITCLVALVVRPSPADAGLVGQRCHGHDATIVGTPGPDRLVGTHGRDVIVALGGDDVILGRAGHDIVCGGPGADSIEATNDHRALVFGGPGADSVLVAHGSLVYAGPGRDHVQVGHAIGPRLHVSGGDDRDSITFRLPPGGQASTLLTNLADGHGRLRGATFAIHDFDKVEVQAGRRGDHWIARGTRADEDFVALKGAARLRATIRAAGGDDHVHTRGGRDLVHGGPGHDTANTGSGIDSCSGVEVTRGCETVSS